MKTVVTFNKANPESMVNKMYWCNHDDSFWFCYKWTRSTGIFLINLDSLQIKDVSERVIDRGYNTIHEFNDGKAYASGKNFTAQEYQEIKSKADNIKNKILNKELIVISDNEFSQSSI